MTVSELITSAYRLIGVLGAGEAASESEINDGFERLNTLIEAWNGTPDAIVERKVSSVSGASGTASLGTRPLMILSASCTASGVTVPVEVCTPARWAEASMERGITAVFSRAVFCDYAYPSATLYIAPLSGGSIQLVSLVPAFTEFADIDDTVTLAPGFRKALLYSLAVESAPEYGRSAPAEVLQTLADTLGGLATLNQMTRGAVPVAAAAA
jgi:hypothetical protein